MALWYAWTAATSDCTSTGTAWPLWCDTTSTSATTNCTATAWIEWTTATGTATPRPVRYQQYRPPVLSAEEQDRIRVAEAERTALWQAAQAERKKQAAKATRRAERTLHEHLSGRQRRQYRRNKSFIVQGRDGHNYRVRQAWAGHVDRLDARGRAVERFCIHPSTEVPLPDNQLIAKLMLETEPDRFRQIANATQLVGAN